MLTSGMLSEYFRRVTAQSKKSHLRSVLGNFGGLKWGNITVQEMVRLYGVIIHMSIYTHHLGGYVSYFKPTSYVRVGRGYNVNIFGYRGWEERIMTLARLCHIRPAFHTEASESDVGE